MKQHTGTSELNNLNDPAKYDVNMSVDAGSLDCIYERLLNKFIPSSVLVDQNRSVLHIFGEAGKLLDHSPGKFSLDLASMLSGELRKAVISAFQLSLRKNQAVQHEAIQARKNDGDEVTVIVNVEPFPDIGLEKTLFLIQLPFDSPESMGSRKDTDDKENTKSPQGLGIIQAQAEEFEHDCPDDHMPHDDVRKKTANLIDPNDKMGKLMLDSDHLLAAIVKNSSDGIITKNLDGKITSWNEGAKDLLQFESNEVIGRNIKLLSPETTPGQKESITEFIQEGELRADFQTQLRRKDGELLDVSVSHFPVYEKGKKEISLIALIIRDISEQKRMQSKLQWSDKLESLGIMAGGIAHEFNNLLTSILANVSISLPESKCSTVIHQSLKEIETASKKAAELCRQMLAYAGKTDSTFRCVNLCDLTKNAVSFIGHSVAKTTHFEVSIPEPSFFIRADSVQIQQVIVDLILNASESFGAEGGKIEIKLEEVSPKDSLIKNLDASFQLKGHRHAALEIKDNGCGIRPEDLTKVFDPFFTTKFTGRGLGLPAVRGILVAHGGGLDVKSKVNVGSTFTVILPLVEESTTDTPDDTQTPEARKTEASDVVRNSPESRESNRRCLIIDDQESIRRALKRLLIKNGFKEVLVASDGQSGFDLFKENRDSIDFVMLDLVMPGWNGAQTLSSIKKVNPDVPVIIMSGYIEDQVNETLESGVSPEAFLQKPFDEKELLKALGQITHLQ